MSNNSETILPQTNHTGATNNVLVGDAFKGDGYYGRADGLHTVQYTLSGFSGFVKIQATLAVEPSETDWFSAVEIDHVDSSLTTGSFIENFTGNYVWVRVKIEQWTDGTIDSIKLNH